MSASYLLSSPPPYSPQHESVSCLPSVIDALKNSLRGLTTSSSKMELEILPFDSVDMYGQPDRDSAYSLSGQVLVSLIPPTGYFCDAPPSDERFILDSLLITFEGQGQFVAPQTGYAACRLIEFSQELVTDGPIPITQSWDQGSSCGPARWYVTFNLTLPGWLPPTCHTTFGQHSRKEPEVNYNLSAVATYHQERPGSSWRSCSGYMRFSTTQTIKTHTVDVTVNRYTLPSPQYSFSVNELPDSAFRSIEYSSSLGDGPSSIPIDVLSKLLLRASVPEHIPVDAGVFPLLLKIRPEGLASDERRRLRLPGFFVNARQNEVLRSSMSTHYAAEWPVPPSSEQPPLKPLRTRREDAAEYEYGMASSPPPGTISNQSYSLLPPGFSGRIEVDGSDGSDSHFNNDRLEDDDTWIRIRIDIPFRDLFVEERHLPQYKYHAVPKLRPSELGPILSVYHTLDLTLTCSYDFPEGNFNGPRRALDELKLSVPLSFVRVPRSGPHHPVVESFSADCGSPLSSSGPAGSVTMNTQRVQQQLPLPSQPYAQSLPTYNLLYHKDGERREDPTPLPRYAPEGQLPEDEPPMSDATVCVQTPPPFPSTKGSLSRS